MFVRFETEDGYIFVHARKILHVTGSYKTSDGEEASCVKLDNEELIYAYGDIEEVLADIEDALEMDIKAV